jgi:hypothetical protein
MREKWLGEPSKSAIQRRLYMQVEALVKGGGIVDVTSFKRGLGNHSSNIVTRYISYDARDVQGAKRLTGLFCPN